VRRAGLALFAAAAVLAGAAPAWSGDDGKVAPTAALSVSPQSVTAGDPVALDASGSRDADGTVTSYAWDLDGDGAFERQSGTEATLAHAFEAAGTHTVGVRVIDDSGDSADATASVQVAEKPAPEPEPAPEPAAEPAQPKADAPAEPRDEAASEDEAASDEEPAPSREPRAARTEKSDRVAAAASQSVSIRDFSFAPRSVSVSVGDTVTWRNAGDEVHTATARDGSFDTGNLATGQSGSHTFNKAGTFSYFCKPHAFMTATVTVTGGGGGGSGGSGGDTQGVTGTGDDGATGTGSAGSGGDLPSTGLELGQFLAFGLAMLAGGFALRRECAPSAS
jgi:plastocyanin